MKQWIIPGRRYNRLVVVEKIGNRKWRCICDCGEYLEVSTSQLGRQKHCNYSYRLPDEQYHQKLRKCFNNKYTEKNGCWEWNKFIHKHGYGVTGYRNRSMLAHRLSWLLFKEPIPDGIDVCHHCDNPKCVNPDHLFLGTAQDNVRDCFNKKRKSHKGEKHPGSKITEKEILEIFRLRKMGWTHQKLADRFKITQSTISNILHRRLWKHIELGELCQSLVNGSSGVQTN